MGIIYICLGMLVMGMASSCLLEPMVVSLVCDGICIG